jgi:hypothetical protein
MEHEGDLQISGKDHRYDVWDNNATYKVLYHASRMGIHGVISPFAGNHRCDFGRGFYCSEDSDQPLKLVCFEANPVLYSFRLNLSRLKVKRLELGREWLLTVAYNRGKIPDKQIYHDVQEKYANILDGYDVITGPIANDRLFSTLDAFYQGLISDKMTIELLNVMKYGMQYVIKTDKACESLELMEKHIYEEKELISYRETTENERSSVTSAMDKVRENFFRLGGVSFREILEKGDY